MENGPCSKRRLHGKAGWKDGASLTRRAAWARRPSSTASAIVDAGDVGDFGFYDTFTLAAWINPQPRTGVDRLARWTSRKARATTWSLKDGKLQVNLVKRWLDDGMRVETEAPVPAESLAARRGDLRRLAARRRREALRRRPAAADQGRMLDELNQSFDAKEPLRIGAGRGPANRFRRPIDEVRDLSRARSLPTRSRCWLCRSPISRDRCNFRPHSGRAAQAGKLRACFLDQYAPRSRCRLRADSAGSARAARSGLVDSFPTAMVMQEMPTPRETYVLMRGAYDQPGEKVEPGVPAVLPPLPQGRAAQPAGLGPLAGRSGQPADGARGGEPLLADVLRPGW